MLASDIRTFAIGISPTQDKKEPKEKPPTNPARKILIEIGNRLIKLQRTIDSFDGNLRTAVPILERTTAILTTMSKSSGPILRGPYLRLEETIPINTSLLGLPSKVALVTKALKAKKTDA